MLLTYVLLGERGARATLMERGRTQSDEDGGMAGFIELQGPVLVDSLWGWAALRKNRLPIVLRRQDAVVCQEEVVLPAEYPLLVRTTPNFVQLEVLTTLRCPTSSFSLGQPVFWLSLCPAPLCRP
jgi:hypothetical protein